MGRIFSSLIIIGGAVLLTATIFVLTVLPVGTRVVTPLENIRSISYPTTTDGLTHITEKLAHADVYLREPVVAKQLEVTLSFIPLDTNELSVGVRSDAFWLSYSWVPIYQRDANTATDQLYTTTITIPLTDKLQNTDRSLDLMLLAGSPSTLATPDENIHDTTYWQLQSIQARTTYDWPTFAELKNYVRSSITKERPL